MPSPTDTPRVERPGPPVTTSHRDGETGGSEIEDLQIEIERLAASERDLKSERDTLRSERDALAQDKSLALAESASLRQKIAGLEQTITERESGIADAAAHAVALRAEMEALSLATAPDLSWAVNDVIGNGVDILIVRDIHPGPCLVVGDQGENPRHKFWPPVIRSLASLHTEGFRKLIPETD